LRKESSDKLSTLGRPFEIVAPLLSGERKPRVLFAKEPLINWRCCAW
jgi:hypothetical protein